MRLDDAYSFRVIDRTVQMVIPALIQVRRTGNIWRPTSGALRDSPPSPPLPRPPQAHQLADGSSPSHVVAVVTRILHVFADALPHVPDHRRLPILSQLMATLGPERFLWVLMLILFKLHATQTARSTSEKAGGFGARHCGSCSIGTRSANEKCVCDFRMWLLRKTWTSGFLSVVGSTSRIS